MTLEEYRQKRDFNKTKEPVGTSRPTHRDLIFVVQKHAASHLHYDLRLEIDGVLKSWAVPKEPPTVEGVKRLAVQVEDHPIEYADFEGVIPEGEYGAGTVEIWDKGTYIPEKISDSEIVFSLNGRRLSGRYVLVKLKPTAKFKGVNNWLLFKKKN